jgi:flagellar assembly protein FliH
MTLVKHNDAVPLLKEAIVLDLGDVAKQARQLREAAQAKARQMLTSAAAEAQRLTENAAGAGFAQGHADGFRRGLEEGRQQGRAEALSQANEQLARIQDAWIQAAAQWDEHCQQFDRDARQAVLELALRLTERLVHRTVSTDAGVVVDQLAAALAYVLTPADLAVHINPCDRPVLEEALPRLMARFGHLQRVGLVEDASIATGGCIVQHGQGRIDATLDTQLQRITELLIPEAPPAEESHDSEANGS